MLASFTLAADEVWRLKRKHDAEGDFFRRFCELGHYRGGDQENDTRQGIYVVAPSGRFLASTNSRDPSQVANTLLEGLTLWRAMDDDRRILENDPQRLDASVERLESKYPVGGLVVKVHSRDLPREGGANDWRANAWNQDFAWFTRKEAKLLSNEGDWPEEVASRFVRCHLIDNVRGQTEAFEPEDIRTVNIGVRRGQHQSGLVHATVRGSVTMERSGHWTVDGRMGMQSRGVDATMLAFAIFDASSERFTSFEGVAVGERWGATRFNGRHDDAGPSPIGWAFELAGEAPADHIAPGHLWDAYDW